MKITYRLHQELMTAISALATSVVLTHDDTERPLSSLTEEEYQAIEQYTNDTISNLFNGFCEGGNEKIEILPPTNDDIFFGIP